MRGGRRAVGELTRTLRASVGAVLVVCAVGAVALVRSESSKASLERGMANTQPDVPAAGRGWGLPGEAGPVKAATTSIATRGKPPTSVSVSRPTELYLHKARSAVFDVRNLRSAVVKRERAADRGPSAAAPASVSSLSPSAGTVSPSLSDPPAPAPDESFDGLDFATWGSGHPPDANGDVGPRYYVQAINSAIGIFDKSTGARVAAFTFNSLMSQGHFGNLCDTDNSGDPVVLYDTFEDRWFVTDVAFKLDSGGNINPQQVFQCFAASKTGDPVTGGWNFYSIQAPGGLDKDAKFGVWPDGIYMSANMFGYPAGAAFMAPHVWALDKAQMYAGDATVQVVDFAAPQADFSVLPANARLQAGTPPAGTPEYFVSTWQFTNGVSVYKLHADWNSTSRSTFTGPDVPVTPTSWPNASVPNAPTPGNPLDTVQIRAMAQAQYSNIGGAESLWVAHTVRRQNTSGFAAPRWYQLNVTGGTVASQTVQATTWDPDGANTSYRFLPSLAVDRVGDLAMGYSVSNSTTNPEIDYAGRLASDPVNTFSQGERTLIAGTGTQTGTCGSPASTCTSWGTYGGMALDPDGCEFWMTNAYYAVSGLAYLTRIGSFRFPGCTTVGNGALSGTVTTAGGSPIAGATVSLGSRTTTTDGSGRYSFTVPAGSYPSLSASDPGLDPSSATDVAVPDGGTATRDFTLTAAATSGCFTDDSQSDFQAGTPNGCDLTSDPGSVQLGGGPFVDQSNSTLGTSGVGITTTTWGGQTFTPDKTGQLTKVDVNLFCSGCTGTTPNLTLSIRATSGGLPTGADLAIATITGFNSGASAYYTATFASPTTVTAGTQYAFVVRPTTNPSPGTYALTRSGTATTGADVYSGGTRVAGATSGTVWSIPLTGGVSTDAGFKIWLSNGFASTGTFVSSLKDANPASGNTADWTTLSFAATTPTGTGVKFQVAASNSSSGPFVFVGPDGTAGTYFTTSGASLSEFDGFRYLRYEAFLSTSDNSMTPTLSSVQVCFVDKVSTSLAVDPATGAYGGTVDLSAKLTGLGSGLAGDSVDFELNGRSVGSATTGATGTATLANVSLAGIDAGSYPGAVVASFAGDAGDDSSNGSNMLTVTPAPLTITASSPSMTYGSAVPQITPSYAGFVNGDGGFSLTTQPTCTTTATASSHVGTYASSCSGASDPDYVFSYLPGTVTINPASQEIAFTSSPPSPAVFGGSYTPTANGGASGNPVLFSIDSSSAAGACSFSSGTTVTFTGVGTCVIDANQVGNADYSAAAQQQQRVTVANASQTITFSPLPSTATARTSAALSATGGGSGQPVTFSAGSGTSPADACQISQAGSGSGTVTFAHIGTCVIDADQAASGDGNTAAAPTVSQTVNVEAVASQVTLPNPATVAFGHPTTVTATVSEADGSTPAGAVQFQVDGQNLGAPVPVGTGGRADSPDLESGGSLAPGAHTLSATFTPADTSVYAPASSSTTQTVNQAASATSLAVQPSAITATVVAVAPGAGTPTGTVTFSVDGVGVGTARLLNGTATLGYAVPEGKLHQVAAVYSGDSDFTGSSASTSRSDPTIAAHVSSSHAKTRYGWYRSPVTVTFSCTTQGAPLTAACPSAVRLAHNGAGQSVTRTISAANGGAATVVVSGIDIDQTKPTVKLTGIHPGATYDGTAPTVHCGARDPLSGIVSCKLRHHETTSGQGLDVTMVRYTATATNRAGNNTTASATYRVLGIYLKGARYEHGRFLVAAGRTYTIVVERSALRPRYIDAAPAPASPAGNDKWFASVGPHRWAQGITITDALAQRSNEWILGVQIGSTLHDLDVQIG